MNKKAFVLAFVLYIFVSIIVFGQTPTPTATPWVIDTPRVITTDLSHTGDIIITDSGSLTFKGNSLIRVIGNITVDGGMLSFENCTDVGLGKYDNDEAGMIVIKNGAGLKFDTCGVIYLKAKLKIESKSRFDLKDSVLRFLQEYVFQYEISVDNATFIMNGGETYYTHPLFIEAKNGSYFEVKNTTNHHWATASARDSRVIYDGVDRAGEWDIGEYAHCEFRNVALVFPSITLPVNSIFNYHLPNGKIKPEDYPNGEFKMFDGHIKYDTDLNIIEQISGISFTLTLANITESCEFVVFIHDDVAAKQPKVTITNSKLKYIGFVYLTEISKTLSGLKNGTYYDDTQFHKPLDDCYLYLRDTTIDIWTYYFYDKSAITIEDSFFGEACSWERSKTIINDSTCDGSAGNIRLSDNSQMEINRSFIESPIITHGITKCTLTDCAIDPDQNILSREYSYVQLLNCDYTYPVNNPELLEINDSAVVCNASLTSLEADLQNGVTTIKGSAWLNKGPEQNTYDFLSYSVNYKNIQGQWIPVVTDVESQVKNDVLASWPSVLTGTYEVQLILTIQGKAEPIIVEKVLNVISN